MRIGLKLFFWVFGLSLSTIPLIMSIANTPGKLPDAFAITSYSGYEAEIVYIGLMMAAITLTETVELLIDLNDTEKWRKLICGVFSLVFIVIVLLYSFWYGVIVEKKHHDTGLGPRELQAVVWLVVFTAVPAFAFKLVLWSRKS